jgi:hypothetical protein
MQSDSPHIPHSMPSNERRGAENAEVRRAYLFWPGPKMRCTSIAAPMIFSEISFSCIIHKSSAVLSVLCASALSFRNLRNQLLAVLENTELPTRDVRNVSHKIQPFQFSEQFVGLSLSAGRALFEALLSNSHRQLILACRLSVFTQTLACSNSRVNSQPSGVVRR